MTAADLAQIPMSADLGQTLTRGSEFAAATGSGEVTLEHLLAALCDDPDAIAVLDASHVEVARLKGDLATQLYQSAGGPGPAHGSLGIAPDVRRILEAAAAAARGSRRRDINGAIVLAAIVGDARSMAAEILQAHGLTFDNAIRALQTALAPQPPREPPTQVPVADDVLARARERVQSRSAPSLRDIMRETPRPLAPPPVASPAIVAPPAPAPSVLPPVVSPPVASPSGDSPSLAPPPEPEVAREVRVPMPAAPGALPSGGDSAGPPPPDGHPGHSLPMANDAAPSGDRDGGFPNLDGVQAEESASSQAEPSLPFPGRPAAAAPGAGAAAAPASAPAARPAERSVFAPQSQPEPQFNPRPAPPGIGSGPPLSSSPFPPSSPGGFGELARPRPGAVLPPPIPPAPMQAGPPPGGMRGRPAGPMPMQPGQPGPPGQAGAHPGLARKTDPPLGGGQQAPSRPQPGPQRGAAERRGKNVRVEAGQLAENIPRSMRVGRTERAEIRIAKASVKALTEGLEGGGQVWQHSVAVTKAMAVRLRAPEGGFFIESASPETQWIENSLGYSSDDFASWRFLITPQERGRARLQIIVSARTVGADGVAAETALPDQVVEVKVRRNIKRALGRLMGWAVAAVIGGALSTFGEAGIGIAKVYVQKFLY